MRKSEQQSWLRLAHAPGMALAERITLVRSVGEPCSLLHRARIRDVRRVAPRVAHWLSEVREFNVDASLAWLAVENHHLLCLDQLPYPQMLGELPDAPVALLLAGDPEEPARTQLSIVGSRRASVDGLRNATQFARDAAAHGFGITSGLARGIDAAAHRGAVDNGFATVAVMATGPDTIYPRQHQKLAARIRDNGALISEFACGAPPKRFHFVHRNRLISGLSAATLVVEAAQKSGSLVTARLAGTQGRDVLAMPGPAGLSQYRGCHDLIREGATLVCEVSQLLQELGWHTQKTSGAVSVTKADDRENCQPRHALLGLIGYSPVSINALVSDSGLSAAELSALLTQLEVSGQIKRVAGGQVVKLG